MTFKKGHIGYKYWKNKTFSLEHIDKLKKSHQGYITPNSQKEKQRISHLGRKYKIMSTEGRLNISKSKIGKELSELHKQKIKKTWNKEELKIFAKKRRSKQIFNTKDTSIEVKIQNYLKELNIEFYTHQYIKEIEHKYKCDIMIPIQEGIERKTIIECFGNYWHNYPMGNYRDIIKCNELREKGWTVLVFWENEIKVMKLDDLNNKLKLSSNN